MFEFRFSNANASISDTENTNGDSILTSTLPVREVIAFESRLIKTWRSRVLSLTTIGFFNSLYTLMVAAFAQPKV